MDQLMRWLISLLSFVEAKYYTLKKGNYTNKNTKKNSLRMEKPGKIIDTEKILDTGEDGKDAVPTLNPGSDKIIEDADLRLHPGKAIIDTAKNTKQNSLRMAKPAKIIDTVEIIDPGEETVRTLNPEKITNTAKIITEQKALITAMLTEED
jgi:hypothetical protein